MICRMKITSETSLKIKFLSFLAAVLVVCIHAPATTEVGLSKWIENLVGTQIASCAVPFFFAVSGYLLGIRFDGIERFSSVYSATLLKRVRSLLIPYLFWCFAFGIEINLVCLAANVVSHYDLARNIDLNPLHIFGLDLLRNPPMPLWFLRALMLYVLAVPLFWWISRRKMLFWLLVGMLMAFDCTKNMYIPEYLRDCLFAFTLSPKNIFAFVFGLYLSLHPLTFAKRYKWIFLLLGTSLYVFLSLRIFWGFEMPYSFGVLISRLSTFLFLCGAWFAVPALQLPKFLEGQSFRIYLLHAVIIPYMSIFSQGRLSFMLSWPLYMVNVSFCVLCCLMISHWMQRRMPSFSNTVFGGR